MNLSIKKECHEEARKIVMMITGNTEAEHDFKMTNDAVYHNVFEHIADLYYLIKTNEDFQNKNTKDFIEKQLFLTSKQHYDELY